MTSLLKVSFKCQCE